MIGYCFHRYLIHLLFLLAVSCIVVWSGNAADLKSLVAALFPAVCIEVDSQLVVKAVEESLVRKLGFEERHIHTGNLLYDCIHLDLLAIGERNDVDVLDAEVIPAAEGCP